MPPSRASCSLVPPARFSASNGLACAEMEDASSSSSSDDDKRGRRRSASAKKEAKKARKRAKKAQATASVRRGRGRVRGWAAVDAAQRRRADDADAAWRDKLFEACAEDDNGGPAEAARATPKITEATGSSTVSRQRSRARDRGAAERARAAQAAADEESAQRRRRYRRRRPGERGRRLRLPHTTWRASYRGPRR